MMVESISGLETVHVSKFSLPGACEGEVRTEERVRRRRRQMREKRVESLLFRKRWVCQPFFSVLRFLDALASLVSMLESDWVMFLRFCQILGISSSYLQGMFKVCFGYVQGMFKVCSVIINWYINWYIN